MWNDTVHSHPSPHIYLCPMTSHLSGIYHRAGVQRLGMDEQLSIFWNILQHSECQTLCDLRLLALADTFAGEVGGFDQVVTFGAGGDGLDGEVIRVGCQHKVSPLVVSIAALPLPVGQCHTFLPCEHLQVRPIHSCLQRHFQAQGRVRGDIWAPAGGWGRGSTQTWQPP